MTRRPLSVTPASRRQFLAWSAGALTATGLAATGCSAPESSSGAAKAADASPSARKLTQIGLDYPFTQIPLYSTLVKLSTAAAKKHDVKLLTTSDASNPDTQASNLNAWVTQKMPAIVSFPMVFEATESIAKAALDAGLIWVTYGGTLENQSADIQFSFRESGTLLGEAAAKWAEEELNGKGKIAFLVDNTIELGRERTKGMIDAFTKLAPGVDVVAQEQAIDPDTGLSKSNALLAKHPDLNIILGITDAAAYGGFKALQQSGRKNGDKKTFVGGQDGSAPSLLAIKQGTFYRASSALAPQDISDAIVDVPLAVAAGKANPSVEVPVKLVQRGDTAEIDALLAQNG
ncbi:MULTISPECIES: sugar ABC transporter substrate-binding protein [Streptomyces]|uniref:Sugar ABC transporter substrate-binding protein n=1 Tax=Streptomyces caniscabiei TaxID=2746961 RepID=A0ABU4MZ22_9ACTN|nr:MULTISPECIES: sugar ABC transporter substrate-binding protein [Streptomyces]MBE4733900.1 sugar ABC transporter substrate-binding protein [Streptomyces caniscabiei]MBE4755077.1 sugar ABC transporter substrate-binding protein [Streptomyces caniscabiei]MBE4768103.1 sugar ABC transporter substrate-binding protein [Streptomyces caniscabiei]MBE4782395.1 sugar ABC transporter substrate-binding protein [Streptomyces caniscabiei]MBE4793683.1 sugar ABC transporter substrate-binding protein [Streptomy